MGNVHKTLEPEFVLYFDTFFFGWDSLLPVHLVKKKDVHTMSFIFIHRNSNVVRVIRPSEGQLMHPESVKPINRA